MGLSWVTVAEDTELETPEELREIFRQGLVGTAGHKELGAPGVPMEGWRCLVESWGLRRNYKKGVPFFLHHYIVLDSCQLLDLSLGKDILYFAFSEHTLEKRCFTCQADPFPIRAL